MEGRERATPGEGYERVLTLPNLLSALRLVGVPLFLWLVLRGQETWAFVVLMVAGLTDYLDGRIARAWDQITRVGEILDPVADRLYILAALVGLVLRDVVPLWVVALVVGRDVLAALDILRLRPLGITGLPVVFLGKAATFALLYAFPLLLLAHGTSDLSDVVRPIAWAFTWWGVALYWLAAAVYHDQIERLLRAARPAPARPAPETRPKEDAR